MFHFIFILFCIWLGISASALLLSKLMFSFSKKILKEQKLHGKVTDENKIKVLSVTKRLYLVFSYIYLSLVHSWGYRSRFYIRKRIGEYLFVDWKGNIHLIVEKDKIETFRNFSDAQRMNALLRDLKSEQEYLSQLKSVSFSTFTMLIRMSYAKRILTDESFKHTKSENITDWVKSSYCTNLLLIWPMKSLYERKHLIDLIDRLELVRGNVDIDKLTAYELS